MELRRADGFKINVRMKNGAAVSPTKSVVISAYDENE